METELALEACSLVMFAPATRAMMPLRTVRLALRSLMAVIVLDCAVTHAMPLMESVPVDSLETDHAHVTRTSMSRSVVLIAKTGGLERTALNRVLLTVESMESAPMARLATVDVFVMRDGTLPLTAQLAYLGTMDLIAHSAPFPVMVLDLAMMDSLAAVDAFATLGLITPRIVHRAWMNFGVPLVHPVLVVAPLLVTMVAVEMEPALV